jgi:hypothetical protein
MPRGNPNIAKEAWKFIHQRKERRAQEAFTPAEISRKEIVSWLQRTLRDDWYARQMPVRISTYEKFSGLSNKILEKLIYEDEYFPREQTLDRLASMIKQIETREVVWHRTHFLYQTPPKNPSRRPKIYEADSGFSVFSKCLTCGGNKWLPSRMDGKLQIMCYSCVPPSQWPALGADDVRFSLIRRYILEIKSAEIHLPKH